MVKSCRSNWYCVHTALKSTVSLTFQRILDLSVHLPVLKHLPLKWETNNTSKIKWYRKTLFTYGESVELCSLTVSAADVVWTGHSTSGETHPIPARSTRRDAAPRRRRPRWWACGGRCPHTASRSSWRWLCTAPTEPGSYSSPETDDTGRSERCRFSPSNAADSV